MMELSYWTAGMSNSVWVLRARLSPQEVTHKLFFQIIIIEDNIHVLVLGIVEQISLMY